MHLKLAFTNLTRTKIRTLLTGATIVIGISSLFLILALNSGIRKAIFSNVSKSNPLNQITVHPPASDNIFTSLIGSGSGTLNQETIDQIRNLPHVQDVYPETSYIDPSSLEVSVFGHRLQTDSMVFGVPRDFIAEEIKPETEWQNNGQPYPALISRKLLDIYNLSVAQPRDLPQITEDMILGREIDIYLGFSSFFAPFTERKDATLVKAKIVGLSNKTSLIGVTLPLEVVETLNQNKDSEHTSEFINAYVITDSPEHIETVAQQIEEMELQTKYLQKSFTQIQDNFRYLTIGLTIISIIILCVSALSIANSFFANINERINEIGILRSLGASKKNIRNLFLAEAALLGTIAGIFGIILGLILVFPINSAALEILPDVSYKPTSLFAFDIFLLLGLTIFSIFFSLISAYIPALSAARLNPIRALNQ